MKKIVLPVLLVLMGFEVYGQIEQQISTGTGYTLQSYVTLDPGSQRQVANTAWDLAFSVVDGEAGVFINESISSATGAQPIEAFYTLSSDFAAVPDTSVYLLFTLWNLEQSWQYGAVNEIRNPDDPDDFGWGIRNPGTGDIDGGQVYVIELRDDTPLKFQIQSLSGGVYTFRYANPDGSGEITKTINKADHGGKYFAYYSFETEDVVEVEPEDGFDFIFERYVAQLHNPQGGDPIPYLVTGVLSAPGVEVAEARGVDPQTVMYEDFVDSLSGNPEVMGHDWKYFDLGGFQWILEGNLVYFVKTVDNHVWKIRYTEFGGSGNGNATFEKTDLGVISAIDEVRHGGDIILYPNPAGDHTSVLIDRQSGHDASGTLTILDAYGTNVFSEVVTVNAGFSVLDLDIRDIPAGYYSVCLDIDDHTLLSRLVVTR